MSQQSFLESLERQMTSTPPADSVRIRVVGGETIDVSLAGMEYPSVASVLAQSGVPTAGREVFLVRENQSTKIDPPVFQSTPVVPADRLDMFEQETGASQPDA
jgi:hypothetical protein